MKKQMVLKKLKKKMKIKLIAISLLVGLAITSGGVYALNSEEREAMKILEAQKKAELQFQKDKANALVSEAKIKQEMIDNANRAKDIIIAKGEYSPLTIEAERQPEISISDKSALASWWSKNVLRVHIPYTIKYMIDMEKVLPIVTEDGLYFEFGIDDFNVIVAPGSYTLMTPDAKEVGLFPKNFENEDVVALLSSNIKVTAEEFSTNQEHLEKALEETKVLIQEIAESNNTKAIFVDKKSTKGATVKVDESLIENKN